jgi:hypothetical protein
MFTMQLDDNLVDKFAEKIADRAYEKLKDKLDNTNQQNSVSHLPAILTRSETKELLRCGDTKIAELYARPDFPVNKVLGKMVPTHMLMKWIEHNTRWVDENTDYFKKDVI